MSSSCSIFRGTAVFLTAFFAFLVLGFTAETATAQTQTSGQRKCILSLNKAATGVAATQASQVSDCVRSGAAGSLGAGVDIDTCVAEPGSKLVSALGKTLGAEEKSCDPGNLPDFGYTPAEDINAAVLEQVGRMSLGLFGADMESSIIPSTENRAASICQQKVARAHGKLARERFKVFVKCKKDGLRDGTIESAEDLESCFDAIQLDERGRIAKAVSKLARDVITRCGDQDLAALFPGDCAEHPDFLTCVDEEAACRSCILLNAVDGTQAVCDEMDNGIIDRSCQDPNANECEGEGGDNDCDANATCTDEREGFTCECNEGFTGDGVECTDFNECIGEGEGNNCHPDANCTNVPSSFECACKDGFFGDGLTCTDYDECAGEGDGNNCDGNASCTNLPGTFVCACNAGYAGDGVTCLDEDECIGEGSGNNCSVNGSCTNLPGSFGCSCNSGFAGDGVVCNDLNECAGENGGNNCSSDGTCTNLPGTFSCACNSGYDGDGVTCTDFNECIGEGGGNNCSQDGSCTNTPGAFTCACNAGYGGDGVTCTDLDECAGENGGNNCSTDAVCTNLPATFSCACKDGFFGNPVGGACQPIAVSLTSPTHGSFTTASSTTVTGTVTANPIGDVTLTINGSPVAIAGNGSFSTNLTLTPSDIFNGIRAEVTQTSTGYTVRDRRVVIWGNSVTKAAGSSQTVGLRIGDSGFDALEPVLTGLVDLDIGTLLPNGTEVFNECFTDSFAGCIARGRGVVSGSSLGSFGVDIDSRTNFVFGDVQLNNLRVDLIVFTTIVGVNSQCDLFRVQAATTNITSNYTLEPQAPDNLVIDVNQTTNPPNVAFSNFTDTVDCGGTGFLTSLLNTAKGDVEALTRNALQDFLQDTDGNGPGDSPIAQAIEDALGAVELTGPIGEGFGVDLSTPMFALPEDNNGVTLASNAIMTTLAPAPGAPTFNRVLVVPSSFPFGPLSSTNTPGGTPFDLAIGIADTGFNQILAAQVEGGLLQTEITEIDLFGTGTPIPLTAGALSSIIPELILLDPLTALTFEIVPTLAPALTGSAGSGGELAELFISHLLVRVYSGTKPNETVQAVIAADMVTSFDIQVNGNELLPVLGAPTEDDLSLTLLDNPLGISEATILNVVPQLLIPVVPSLSSLLGAIPLPQFLGLTPTPVEVSRAGDFLGIFMTVVTGP